MKRWLSAVMIAVFLITCLLGTYAMAEDAAQKVKTTGSVNIRSGPGLDYKTLGAVKKGKTLPYLGEKKKDDRGVVWYRVEYKGTTKAWVSSRYSKLTGSSSSSGSSSSGSSSSGSSTVSGKDEGYGLVKANADINIRKGHSTDHKALGSVPKGSTVTYLGESYKDDRGVTWYKVKYNGSTGWMSGKYSSLSKGSKTVKSSGASKESESSSKSETKPAATPKPTATPKPVSYGTVRVSDSLNVRTGPGLDFDSIGTVANKTLTYHGDSCTDDRGVTWYRVTFDGRSDAWVSSKYATLSADSETVSTGTAGEASGKVKATTNVNLRIGPGTANAKTGGMDKNQSLAFMGAICTDKDGTNWYMVRTASGVNAWVCADYARIETESAQTTVSATVTTAPVVSVWASDDDIRTGDLNWFTEEDLKNAAEAEPVNPFVADTASGELSGETVIADTPSASPWDAPAAVQSAALPWDLNALPAMARAGSARELTGALTQEQILSALGVAGTDQLKNTTGALLTDADTLKISLDGGVFTGGIDGYLKPWNDFDGVVSALETDLDGDNVDEFAALYVRDGSWNFAAFEPVSGGWQFVDEITLDLNESGERFVRLTDLAAGKGVFAGNVSYIDGGAAIINGVVYCYTNGSFLGEAMFSSANVSYSYVVYGKKFSVDSVERIDSACQNYPYHPEQAAELGIQENINFIYNDLGGYKPVVDPVNGKVHPENFAGLDMIGVVLAPCGVETGYEIFANADGTESYSVILSGGEVILRLYEDYGSDGQSAFVVMQAQNSPTVSGGSAA